MATTLTGRQMEWLADLAAGRDPYDRYSGRSERGGANTVERALHQRGLLSGGRLQAPADDLGGRVPLFLYGTLMRGGRLHDAVRGQQYLGAAETVGQLYSVADAYPVLVTVRTPRLVQGECWAVDAATLQRLDRIELGAGYQRVPVPAIVNGKAIAVQAYAQPLVQVIRRSLKSVKCNCWRTYAGLPAAEQLAGAEIP